MQEQDSKSMICSLKDMDPMKLSCQNYNSSLYEREGSTAGNNQEGNLRDGQGIQGMMGSQAEMHHMDMADHQYQQWGANPLSLSQVY